MLTLVLFLAHPATSAQVVHLSGSFLSLFSICFLRLHTQHITLPKYSQLLGYRVLRRQRSTQMWHRHENVFEAASIPPQSALEISRSSLDVGFSSEEERERAAPAPLLRTPVSPPHCAATT